MGSKGPLLTLLGGAALASVLIGLNVHASTTPKTTAARTAPSVALSVAPSSAAPASPSAQAPASVAPAAYRATYAGYTKPDGAMISIAVRDGTAIAYLCDGSKVEAWLKGTVSGGKVTLTGSKGANLTATYAKGVMTGTVNAGGKHFTFKIRAVYAPSGLYKASAIVRDAKIESGWIYYNGRQVGMQTVNGVEQPAATLNIDTRTATVNGETITASPVDGATGSGF
jgi:serine/threonine-protein kinase